jgi:hypothetical protein
MGAGDFLYARIRHRCLLRIGANAPSASVFPFRRRSGDEPRRQGGAQSMGEFFSLLSNCRRCKAPPDATDNYST